MIKYEYEVSETKSIDVPNCPLCGSIDLQFWNYSRDCSMHGAAAGIKCRECGHEVKVDGNELHMDSGKDCQLSAISKWKYQVERWGKHNPELPPEIEDLQKELQKIRDENNVLKSVIALENYSINIRPIDDDGVVDLKTKFLAIMRDFTTNKNCQT